MAAEDSVDPGIWSAEFESLMALIGGRFARCEAAAHAGDLVAGLVSDLERKNCWTIAERVGHRTPGRLQHLLAGAVWDAGEVRDDLCGYVIDRLDDLAIALPVGFSVGEPAQQESRSGVVILGSVR